jgi:asparagine synthetase B (glutamine-hydrolysing)
MPGVTFLGAPDPVLAWTGTGVYATDDVTAGVPPPARLDGPAAAAQPLDGGGVRLFRDRLGLGKLFWARDGEGALVLAARPAELVRAGHALDQIMSLPRGRMVELDAGDRPVAEAAIGPAGPRRTQEASLAETGAEICATLDSYLAAVASTFPGRRACICLSGGLDSSTIAVLARRHFPALTAVSFDLARPGRRESEDRAGARRLAADLDIPVIEATVMVEKLLSYLDLVLVAGIDWRDFNVHCGLVNATLAEAIVEAGADEGVPPLVITGDLPNELVVDYHTETYRGASYYKLPRLEPAALRMILVNGLDTCHREIGVFGAFGLTVAQPYAACVDAYLGLPADFLKVEDRKERLVREIVGAALPDYIYRRSKVRAQIGDLHDGGTLAACIDHGIDAAWLRRRFAELHAVRDEQALDRFIRAGRYRAAIPARERYAHGRL